ncbi:hypothetical protein ACEPAH_2888 [Sanghuangporus vaninii]
MPGLEGRLGNREPPVYKTPYSLSSVAPVLRIIGAVGAIVTCSRSRATLERLRLVSLTCPLLLPDPEYELAEALLRERPDLLLPVDERRRRGRSG